MPQTANPFWTESLIRVQQASYFSYKTYPFTKHKMGNIFFNWPISGQKISVKKNCRWLHSKSRIFGAGSHCSTNCTTTNAMCDIFFEVVSLQTLYQLGRTNSRTSHRNLLPQNVASALLQHFLKVKVNEHKRGLPWNAPFSINRFVSFKVSDNETKISLSCDFLFVFIAS